MKRVEDYDVFVRAHELNLKLIGLGSFKEHSEIFEKAKEVCTNILLNLKSSKAYGEIFFDSMKKAQIYATWLEYYLLLLKDLKVMKDEDYNEFSESITVIQKMIYGILRKEKKE